MSEDSLIRDGRNPPPPATPDHLPSHTRPAVGPILPCVTDIGAALPSAPGVYRFRDAAGRAVYIGRATNLRHRVLSYWGALDDRPHLRRMVGQVARVEALPCASAHEAAWLERNLLEAAKPRWNRVRGGLEVPTYVTLSRSAGAVRLAVTHGPAIDARTRTFGPYLGGTRSRRAVDGLERALGLAYTADRLGGFDRDMARVRGVASAERDARAELAESVLGGDAVAAQRVTELLVARRDDAVATLAFEVAGRIQEEIAALAWIAAPQRVTADVAPGRGPGSMQDTDLAGWADGVLVQLAVRNGRLDRWRARPASEARAAHLVAATPETWAGWVADAARLAAALRDAELPRLRR